MQKTSFNHDWTFERGSGTSFAALLGGANGQIKVTLPHDAEITAPRNPEEPNGSGNGFFHSENYVYTKRFAVDEADREKVVILEFEGIYQNAFVYVNNAFVVKHPYGYGNFYADVTGFVQFGVENEVKVVVKNAGPSGRWYTGGGIYRDVNLMIANRVHIVPDGVRITTRDLDDELATICVDTELVNRNIGSRTLKLRTELLDADGKTVAEDVLPLTLAEGKEGTYRQWLLVDKPNAWDVDHPYRYSYHVTVLEGETILDEESGRFGIRTISVDARRGLRINGKTVKLAGGCIHHDCGIVGTAEFAHAEEVRVRDLKAAGFNAIRSSHYPMSRRLLEECDRQGMYVMDEFADVWTSSKVDFDYGTQMADWWELDVANLVRKDYNHPSVILYSIGNEIPETGNPIDVQWGKKLSDRLRALDNTRFTVNSMNVMLSVMDKMPEVMAEIAAKTGMDLSGAADGQDGEINSMMSNLGDMMSMIGGSDFAGKATAEAAGQVDITGYNYTAMRYEIEHALYPNRVMMGSETNPGDLDVNWDLVMRLPYIVGDFDWTAYDYLGEAGIGKVTHGEQPQGLGFYAAYPCKAAYCGDIDLLSEKQPVAYWRETIWGIRTDPYIAVQPPQYFGQKINMSQWRMTDTIRSWNYTGMDGKPIKVEVYADADEIELFVNGESAGVEPVGGTKKNIAVFETVYHPGKVEAIARRGGQEIGRDILETADSEVSIRACADVEAIPADESDIGYIEISIEDAKGRRNPEVTTPVSIEIAGPGVIQGYGSADPESEENYYDTTARPFGGRLRAAIRGNGEKGTITVTLKAAGMADAVVTIEAV